MSKNFRDILLPILAGKREEHSLFFSGSQKALEGTAFRADFHVGRANFAHDTVPERIVGIDEINLYSSSTAF